MKWVKHDTDANQDAKLQNVLLDYGLEGYGLYWYCIELIAGKVNKDAITFELEHDARIIARNTGATTQKVEEMMRYFVKIGLFEVSQGVITCLKLAKRLDKSMTSNPEMRVIIDNLKNHDGVMTQSEKPMQDKNRLDIKDNVGKIQRPLLEKAFNHTWEIWKDCKKQLGANNNSSKKDALEKAWFKIFNTAYCKKNDEDYFRREVNAIIKEIKSTHQPSDFNSYANMHYVRFLKLENWKKENK